MDVEISAAYIGAAAVVIAAVIGVIGALVGRRSVRQHMEEERNKLVVEKGGQILPEISTRLGALISEFRSLLDKPFLAHDQEGGIDWQTLLDNMDARRTKAEKLADQVTRLQDYHTRSLTWIPSELDRSIDRLAGELIGHINLYARWLPRDIERAKSNTDFLISQFEVRKRIDKNLKRFDETFAETREANKHSTPLEDETEPAAEPQAPTDEFDALLDELEADLKRRSDENREMLKELGKTEDAEKTFEDLLVQYDNKTKTREEVLLEVYEEYHAETRKFLREWLDTDASEKLKSVQQQVREILGVDTA